MFGNGDEIETWSKELCECVFRIDSSVIMITNAILVLRTVACAMFQNSNSLPIALMQSFIGEGVPLQWNVGDSQDDMLGRALTCLSLPLSIPSLPWN